MQTWYAWVSYNQFPMDTKGWLDIIHNFLASIDDDKAKITVLPMSLQSI